MSEERKSLVRRLLEGIETGDPDAVHVIHPERYIEISSGWPTIRSRSTGTRSRRSRPSPSGSTTTGSSESAVP